jgi:hypothetical protein
MRITLDIDDIVLEAAEELAEREGRTPGQVLSDLARRGIILCRNSHKEESGDDDAPYVTKDGIPVLRARGGIVTNGMIKRLQQEIDDEELRKAIGHAHHPRHRR